MALIRLLLAQPLLHPPFHLLGDPESLVHELGEAVRGLLAEGLISQDEYDRKRAEILEDL